MIEVDLPDGSIAEFPDGTPSDVIKGALQKKFGSKPQAQSVQLNAPNVIDVMKGFTPLGVAENLYSAAKDPMAAFRRVDDGVRALADGVTFGYGDKAAAGIDAAMGQGNYQQNLSENRQMTADAMERGGAEAMAANVVGGALGPSKLASMGLTAAKIPGMLGRYGGLAIDGAVIGGLNAAGHDEDIAQGAGLGFAGGAAGQTIGSALAKASGAFNAKPNLPTADDLAAQSRAAYQKAENAGVIINPQAMGRLRQDVYDDYANFGYHPELQPGAKVAFNELDRLSQGGNVDLKGLEGLRKIAGGAYNPINPSNNALVGKTTGRIDDFLENLRPDDVLSGNPVAAAAALKDARKAWGQKAKLTRVDDLLEKAGLQAGSTGSGGNIENASRQQLKKLLTNPKLTRGMTKDEIAATKDAVLGTKPQNLLRLLGKLSPQGNGLMLAIQAAGGVASGGMTIPLAIAGYGAKKASETITKKNAELLKAIIAGGGLKSSVMPKQNAAQRLLNANKGNLARLLVSGSLATASE